MSRTAIPTVQFTEADIALKVLCGKVIVWRENGDNLPIPHDGGYVILYDPPIKGVTAEMWDPDRGPWGQWVNVEIIKDGSVKDHDAS